VQISEEELYSLIESSSWFSQFSNVQRQWEIGWHSNCYVDYKATDSSGRNVLIEVKNWGLRVKDIEQIVKYLCHANNLFGVDNFRFMVICAFVHDDGRKPIIDKLGVEVFLLKDVLGNRI
jgi:predicted RecB family endonuclease